MCDPTSRSSPATAEAVSAARVATWTRTRGAVGGERQPRGRTFLAARRIRANARDGAVPRYGPRGIVGAEGGRRGRRPAEWIALRRACQPSVATANERRDEKLSWWPGTMPTSWPRHSGRWSSELKGSTTRSRAECRGRAHHGVAFTSVPLVEPRSSTQTCRRREDRACNANERVVEPDRATGEADGELAAIETGAGPGADDDEELGVVVVLRHAPS